MHTDIIKRSDLKLTPLLKYGTEGSVFKVSKRYVIKAYHKPDAEKFRKIAALIDKIESIPLSERNFIKRHMVIPVNLISDENNNLFGYKMRYVSKRFEQVRTTFHNSRLPYKYRLKFCWQLAELLTILHRNNIKIGDFNPSNFLCTKKGQLLVVDTDSVDFIYNNHHYKCTTYFPEALSDRAYSSLLRHSQASYPNRYINIFTEKNDDYSFAYTVFKLLVNGSPYGCVPAAIDERNRQILKLCPFFKEFSGYTTPLYMVDKDYLPKELYNLFLSVFLKGQQHKPDEFRTILKRMYYNPKYTFCRAKTYDGEYI